MNRHAKAPSAFTFGRKGFTALALLSLAFAALFALAFASNASAGKIVDRIHAGTTTSGTTGGLFSNPRGIAVNRSGAGPANTGDVYVVDGSNNRIQQFAANGSFIRAFGQDVIGINEQQRITISATGGTYTLTFGANTTANINFNATGIQVATALAALPSIGAGNVSGSGSATQPKVITFQGALAGTDVAELTANSAGLTGGTASVTIETTVTGAGGNFAGYEVCTTPSLCKAGVTTAQTGGAMNAPQGIAIDQSDGSLYVTDQGNRRVQKFSGDGTFDRAFGWDVKTGGVTTFEVCTVASECKIAAAAGGGAGQFAAAIGHPAVNPSNGNVLIADATNRRIQEFESDGDWIRAWGWDVVQPGGTGEQTAPVNEQQRVRFDAPGFGNTVSGGTFTLSFDPDEGGPTPAQETAQIDWNAGGVTVDAALEALPSIGAGNVNVTGPPQGGVPWTVEFTGALALTNVPAITGDTSGITTLFGVPGVFSMVTLLEGGPAPIFEICTVATECKAGGASAPPDQSGAFAAASPTYLALDSGGTVYASDPAVSNRVQRFDSTEAAAPDLLRTPIPVSSLTSTSIAAATTGLEVDPSSGNLLVARNAAVGVLEFSDPDGTPAEADRHYQGANLNPTAIAIDGAGDDLYLSSTTGGHRVFAADDDGAPLALVTIDQPTDVEAHSAIVSASVTPNGPAGITTFARLQVSRNGVTWTDANAEANVGEGSSPVTIGPVEVTDLEGNSFYRIRVVARKSFGNPEVTSAELTFVTDGTAPEVETFYPQDRTDTTARLGGQINPNNQATSYHFEYGKTTAYGSNLPILDGSLSGGTDKSVFEDASGLEPDTVYHYRLVATNPEGTSFGDDVAFRTRAAVPAQTERAFEMVTPPFKVVRTAVESNAPPRANANPGFPSLDGNAIAWNVPFFPLTEDVGSPNNGEKVLIRRTSQGWVSSTRNTLKLAAGVSYFQQQNILSASGDLEAVSWNFSAGTGGDLLPTEGGEPHGTYIRRDGTGVEGFTPWLTNAARQVRAHGIPKVGFNGYGTGFFNDDGSAMAHFGPYRGLNDLPGDDWRDPSDDQLLFGADGERPLGGASLYLQRADDPDAMPTAPKDLVQECTGATAGGDATEIPARLGTGAATDTIGTQTCVDSPAPDATGSAIRSPGSPVLTGVATESGAFSVGQHLSGEGIPGGATIASVGAGTLTMSANAVCGAASGQTAMKVNSPVLDRVLTFCGEFEVGQTISGANIPPGTTIVAIDGTGMTLSADATKSDSDTAISTAGTGLVDDLAAGNEHRLTSPRGAKLGGGSFDISASPIAGIAATAMSNDGNRIFFTSPDFSVAPTSCSTATGTATNCPPQLFVRQYTEGGDAAVRWISRSRSNSTADNGYDGAAIAGQQIAEMGAGAGFEGASRDGRVVYFKTNAPLTPDDPNGGKSITTDSAQNTSWDLYRYELPADRDEDPDGGVLTRITGGVAGTADPSTGLSVGTGGGFGGKEAGSGGALRVLSDDGRRAYFVTTSPIDATDATPPQGGVTTPAGAVGNGTNTSGVRNLYLFDDHESGADRYKFIAQLPFATVNQGSNPATLNTCASSASVMGDQYAFMPSPQQSGSSGQSGANCFRITPDGEHVIFFTGGQLTADDTDSAGDIYLYDAADDELTRVSASRKAGASPYGCGHYEDGVTAVFCNADMGTGPQSGLASGLGGKYDGARGWGGGRYMNISEEADGTVSVFFESRSELIPEDTNGDYWDVYQWREGKLSLVSKGNQQHDSWFSGNSVDGRDVFIWTSQRIDPREIDDGDFDVYDARIGGGIPYTPPPTPCDVLAFGCEIEAIPAAPARAAASANHNGAGNLKATGPKPRRCAKGKVRRGGRCVNKKAKKASKRDAKRNRRAGR